VGTVFWDAKGCILVNSQPKKWKPSTWLPAFRCSEIFNIHFVKNATLTNLSFFNTRMHDMEKNIIYSCVTEP
jgi:hypothetical protein